MHNNVKKLTKSNPIVLYIYIIEELNISLIRFKIFKVLLCANNRPVLNDVTYAELVLIVQRAAKISTIIDNSLKSGRLLCLNSGMYP